MLGLRNKHRLAGTRSDQLLDNEHIFEHATSLPSSLMMVLRISSGKDNAIKVYVRGTVKVDVDFCSRKMTFNGRTPAVSGPPYLSELKRRYPLTFWK